MSRIFRLLLALLLIAAVFGQTAAPDSDSADTTASSDDDSDSMTATGDSDDSDDDDSDSMSATGDSEDSDDDDDTSGDSDDTNSGDSDDDTDSGDSDDDSTDSTSGDSDTDSTDSDSTDSSDNGSGTVTTASTVSYCAQLTSSDCVSAYADDGTAICAMNAVSQSCYAVVASSGMYGSGNYDDGYTAAAAEMEKDTSKLNTIVGVLSALVALLVLTFVGGGYFFWKKQQEHQVQMGQDEVSMPTPQSMEDDDAMLMDE